MDPKNPKENPTPNKLVEKISKFPPFLPSEGHSDRGDDLPLLVASYPSQKPTWGGYLTLPDAFDVVVYIPHHQDTPHPFAGFELCLKDEAGDILLSGILSDKGTVRFYAVQNKPVRLVQGKVS